MRRVYISGRVAVRHSYAGGDSDGGDLFANYFLRPGAGPIDMLIVIDENGWKYLYKRPHLPEVDVAENREPMVLVGYTYHPLTGAFSEEHYPTTTKRTLKPVFETEVC